MSIVQTRYLLYIYIKKREKANRFVNCIDGQKDNWVLSPSNNNHKYIDLPQPFNNQIKFVILLTVNNTILIILA